MIKEISTTEVRLTSWCKSDQFNFIFSCQLSLDYCQNVILFKKIQEEFCMSLLDILMQLKTWAFLFCTTFFCVMLLISDLRPVFVRISPDRLTRKFLFDRINFIWQSENMDRSNTITSQHIFCQKVEKTDKCWQV